jgi:hypothetical protein
MKDALAKLKSENRKLRKENSRLRKELSRADDYVFEKKVDEELEESGTVVETEEKTIPECPKCHSHDFNEIPAGRYLIKVCRSCGYRKRSQVKE